MNVIAKRLNNKYAGKSREEQIKKLQEYAQNHEYAFTEDSEEEGGDIAIAIKNVKDITFNTDKGVVTLPEAELSGAFYYGDKYPSFYNVRITSRSPEVSNNFYDYTFYNGDIDSLISILEDPSSTTGKFETL